MATEVKIPVIGESVEEATLSTWSVSDGDIVEEGDILCEIESDKASLELPAEVSGKITLKASEGDDLKIGSVIAEIDESAAGDTTPKKEAPKEEKTESNKSAAQAQNSETPSSNEKSGVASPAARKILAEKSLSPDTMTGTGKDGRITKSDAMAANASEKKESSSQAAKSAQPATSSPAAIMQGGSREINREKMTRLRKTIAKRLTEAKNSTAMLTTFNEVDMKPVMDLRKKYQDQFVKKHGIKLGFMSLFTKACCVAMKNHPLVNAQIEGEELLIPDYVDMGIAVSSDKGLVVPVVRNAESQGLADIEKEISRLATKAREGKITLDEMSGGTFTITNGGIFGSMLSTPILNIPQSAILGMHNIVERPWVVDGKVEIRPIMYIALSYDHRVIDGKDSVGFLKTVKDLLEDPARMILDL
ncbi:MAG: dihydrolipoyllysine-residue succinyltransferase [Halobacteriovoraceae bacterium]|nr:dihydrolipoyllysine-residue succinyltransferase [Halobacteriovoraceae bacterium]